MENDVPVQQNETARKESHVYVQKPSGEEVTIKAEKEASNESPEQSTQSAENTPTTASSEVTDGEEG